MKFVDDDDDDDPDNEISIVEKISLYD